MNNFVLASQGFGEEEKLDTSPLLRKRVEELAEIIGALRAIQSSNYWKVLEEKIWKSVVDGLTKELRKETDPAKIYRIQGRLEWALKYTDLKQVEKSFEAELKNITNQLYGQTDIHPADVHPTG